MNLFPADEFHALGNRSCFGNDIPSSDWQYAAYLMSKGQSQESENVALFHLRPGCTLETVECNMCEYFGDFSEDDCKDKFRGRLSSPASRFPRHREPENRREKKTFRIVDRSPPPSCMGLPGKSRVPFPVSEFDMLGRREEADR